MAGEWHPVPGMAFSDVIGWYYPDYPVNWSLANQVLPDMRDKRIADLETRLSEYRALYRRFGQDDTTDSQFVAEFERVYLADKTNT